MRRRGFLASLIVAPLASVLARRRPYATGGVVSVRRHVFDTPGPHKVTLDFDGETIARTIVVEWPKALRRNA